MERIGRHLSYANVAATLALVFAMSGGAIAATGGFTATSSSIKACAGSNGVLKLQTGKKCKHGQKAVTWSRKGPAGAKGATGATGASGIAGSVGPAGSSATVNGVAAGGALAGAYPNPKLGQGVVTSANVIDRALTLADLGGPDSADETFTVSVAITLAVKQCINQSVGLINPAVGPSGASVIGSMVIGTLTNASGNAAVDNEVSVAPSMLIATSQGGAIVNLILCNASGSTETVPAGSVFHWRLIGP
jgi:hypothetical protein